MNIVDSSGWLEFFTDGPFAEKFVPPLRSPQALIVPVITIYEVFKVISRERGDDEAYRICSIMEKGQLDELKPSSAIFAAQLSKQFKLPMADSIILATARLNNATIWTLDSDFKNIKGVRYFSNKRK